MIVKDAMVVIHLAKITMLEKSCSFFGETYITKSVHNEIKMGTEKEYGDVLIIEDLIKKGKIIVMDVGGQTKPSPVAQFNIQGAEADAVNLYHNLKADFLATDDDNVRKKSDLLNLKVVGTLGILLKLYRERIISREKFEDCLKTLRKIGWFSNAIVDRLQMEE